MKTFIAAELKMVRSGEVSQKLISTFTISLGKWAVKV